MKYVHICVCTCTYMIVYVYVIYIYTGRLYIYIYITVYIYKLYVYMIIYIYMYIYIQSIWPYDITSLLDKSAEIYNVLDSLAPINSSSTNHHEYQFHKNISWSRYM